MTIKLYKVGGYVRDQILGIPSKDIDYAVEASSFEEMKNDILNRGGKIYLESPQFFTIRAKLNGEDADFVLCRKEGAYRDSRHPDSVEIGTIDNDLARRDFTMNAIAIREDGSYYDPHYGIRDIQNRVIRCVGGIERLEEDGLRILRAIRFHITKEFHLDNKIIKFLVHDIGQDIKVMENVSDERIMEELNRMFETSVWKTLEIFKLYSDFFDNLFYERKNLKFKTYVAGKQ